MFFFSFVWPKTLHKQSPYNYVTTWWFSLQFHIYIIWEFLFFVDGTDVQDDVCFNDYNVPKLVDLFVEYAENQVCNVTIQQIMFVLCNILLAI
jgi:hypothetical protein